MHQTATKKIQPMIKGGIKIVKIVKVGDKSFMGFNHISLRAGQITLNLMAGSAKHQKGGLFAKYDCLIPNLTTV